MKPSIKYGLTYAGIAILWSLVMYVTELNRSDYASAFQMISLIAAIVLIRTAVLDYQKNIGNGWITFNQAFREGLVVMVVGTIITSLFTIVYMQYIDTDFVKFIIEKQANKMAESGMSDEQVQQAMAMTMKMMSPMWMMVWGLFGGLFLGSIISLIMAAILKKPNPEEIA